MYHGATTYGLALPRLGYRGKVVGHLGAKREQLSPIHAKASVPRDEHNVTVLEPEGVVPREFRRRARSTRVAVILP